MGKSTSKHVKPMKKSLNFSERELKKEKPSVPLKCKKDKKKKRRRSPKKEKRENKRKPKKNKREKKKKKRRSKPLPTCPFTTVDTSEEPRRTNQTNAKPSAKRRGSSSTKDSNHECS